MKVNQSVQNQLQNLMTQKTDQPNRVNLKVGQRVNAFVMEVMEDLARLNIEGKVVIARQKGESTLTQGQVATLEVIGKQDNILQVKLLDATSAEILTNDLSAQLEGQLNKLGIAVTDKALLVLKAMHEQGQVVSKENFSMLQQEHTALSEMAKLLQQSPDKPLNWQSTAKQLLSENNLATDVPLQENANPSTENSSGKALNNLNTDSQNVLNQSSDKTAVNKLAQENLAEAETIKAASTNRADKGGLNNVAKEGVGLTDKPFAFLDKNLKQAFLQMVSDSKSSMQTLAFMQRHQVKPTLLNTVLFNHLLSGKMGMMSSLEQLLKDDAGKLPVQLKEALTKLFETSPKWQALPEKFDGEALKALLEASNKLQQSLIHLKANSETGEKAEHIAAIKQSQSLLSASPIPWQALPIPIQLQRQIEDVEIYIKGDAKKDGKLNPDDGLIYIALNTQHMSLIKVKIKLLKDVVRIDFITDKPPIKAFMQKNVNDLKEALSTWTKKEVNVAFNAVDETPNLAELEKVDIAAITAFDMKV